MKTTLHFLTGICLGLFVALGNVSAQDGQCITAGACTFTNTFQWPETTQSTTSSSFVELSPDMWPGDFAVCNVVSGTTYEWSLCPADGGDASYDAQMTLFNGTTNALLCFSDDVCEINPKIRYVATFTGTVKLQVNEFDCQEGEEFDTRVMWRTISTIQNDAAVALVYSQGVISTQASNPQVVRAIVSNEGLLAQTNLAVTLTISGANTFTNTVTVPTIAPGASVVVTFPGYNSTALGTNTITISLPNDGNNANNSRTQAQTVTANQLSYEIGAIPTSNVGFNNAVGEIASKFTVSGTRAIDQVSVRFQTAGASYQVKIFSANANGEPGTELYTTPNRTAVVGLANIDISPAVSVTDNFFVVVRQVTPAPFLSLAYQEENPIRSQTFYFRAGTTTTWSDLLTSGLNFRIMVGARIGGCAPPASPGQIAGEASICSSSSNTYSVSPVQDATSYTWTLPNDWTGTSTTNSISATAGASGGNITVTANSQCGSSTASTLTIIVNPTPVIAGPITGESGACAGGTLSYSVATVPGATSYTWTLPAGWGGTSTTNTISASVGSGGGTISVTATGTCGTSAPETLQVSIVTTPAAPANITGSATICSGTTQTYTAAPVAGAASYQWTLPAGWSGTSSSNVINITAGTASGNVEVRAINACGQSNVTTLALTVSPAGNSAFTYPTNAYCVGSPNPTATPVAPGGTFSATPAGLVFANLQTGEINLQNSNPGNYTVTYTTSGACSTSTNTTVTIAPAVSAAFTYSATTYCNNSTTNPVPTLGSGASIGSFSSTPAGLNFNAATGAITLSGSQPGSYTITNSIAATAGCAAATANATVIINAAPTATVSGGATICSDGTQTIPVAIALTGTAPFNFTYSVGGNPTPITGYAGNSFVINAATTGTYTVTTVSDATTCQSAGTGNAVVTINLNPTVTLTPFPNNLCVLAPGINLANGSPAGGTYTGPGVTNNVLTPALAGVGTHILTYAFTSPQNCSGSASINFVVEVCVSNKPSVDNNLQIWPNPTSEQLYIRFPGMTQANTTFHATALDGKSIDLTAASSITTGEATLAVHALPKGLYLLNIHHKGVLFKKMISIR